MRCPYCTYTESKVTDSRVVENGIRRRRECQRCGLRFTTYERIQATALMVSKQDNRREEFNREKLTAGIRKACAKRPVSSRTIEKMVEDIEAELQHMGHVEVPTTILGSMVMERLINLDRVAYIRYASVYRDFQDIESFERAVKDLREEGPQLPLPEGPGDPVKPRRRANLGQHRPRTPGPSRRPGRPRSTGV
ncbi:MAG: transcriptional repressor NrdR [Chloroflexi bacterium]|nr:transcriptional repressor NrdR [Chloroflexota bacterium]MCH8224327.1 transcriptional repressor NrdR [Chloroflexota bacterium]MCI0845649.1 transcriptional repressor NrdR [Chloroflexota bacterium]